MSDGNSYLEEMFGLSETVAVITGGAGAIAGALAAAETQRTHHFSLSPARLR